MNTDQDKSSQSLKFAFWEGIFASGMTGFIQEYLTPFLLVLGATVKHVGMLHALPNIFASLVQLRSAEAAEKAKSRLKILNIFIFCQALMLVPIFLLAIFKINQPYLFIACVILFVSFGAFAAPAWGSMMSDLVKENKRGEYFGWRNKVLGFTMVGAALLAGLILYYMKRIDVYSGFAVIFGGAFIFRLISWNFLRKMYEPHLEHKQEHRFSIIDFLAKLHQSNFAKFVIFVALMNFSVNLAAPFFAVLMLRDLQFNYLIYSLIVISATFTIYLTISRWGRQADKIGNLKIIRFTSQLMGLIPLLWIINRHPAFLIFAQIFSGFIWAGFNLCTSNYILDAVTPQKRTRCIAYFNVLNGIALCCGALLGGFLIQFLPPLLGYQILTLFLISALLRIGIGFYLPRKLKEVRPIEKVKSNKLFYSMIRVRPRLGIERKTVRYDRP
jgi:MFS family permease